MDIDLSPDRAWMDPPDPGDTFRRSWRAVDLGDVLNGTWAAPQPDVGHREDGVGLLYPGKVHTLSSESEGGKTWLALAIALDELASGHHVVYLDFEDDEGGIAGRLLTMGANRDTLAQRFHYVRPEDPLGGGLHRDDLDDLLTTYRPTLAVIDGVTEAMTLHGLSPLDNTDVAKFGRMLPKRLAAAGVASLSLDHVTKAVDGRGRYALGAVHKLNGIDGAALVLENRRPFGVGITGRSSLKIAKDRPGQLRKHALPSAGGMFWLGDLVVTSHAEEFAEVELVTPQDRDPAEYRPTVVMGRIMAALTEHGPLSQRRIRAAVTGKSNTISAALDFLILDGYVSESTPHTILKPYSPQESS